MANIAYEENTVGFLGAIKKGFNNAFVWSTRASRSEFWYWQLFVYGAAIILSIVDLYVMPADAVNPHTGEPLMILSSLFYLITFFPSIAVMVRRFHDTNHTGWWYWLPIAAAVTAMTGNAVIVVGSLVLAVLWVLYLLVKEGDMGDNRYGPNPLAL